MLLEFTPRWKARMGRPREAIYLHLLSTSISLLFPHFVSSFSSLLTFIFCFSHLFTPGRRKATKRLLDFNCPTPFNVASGWRKCLFLVLSCICFSPPAAAVTLSLSDLFSMFLPWKVVPLSVPARMMLGYFGMMSLWLQVVGQEKITEPPKVMGEVLGSSLERDWMVRNPAPLPQLLHFPLLVVSDGEPRTPRLPPHIENKHCTWRLPPSCLHGAILHAFLNCV